MDGIGAKFNGTSLNFHFLSASNSTFTFSRAANQHKDLHFPQPSNMIAKMGNFCKTWIETKFPREMALSEKRSDELGKRLRDNMMCAYGLQIADCKGCLGIARKGKLAIH